MLFFSRNIVLCFSYKLSIIVKRKKKKKSFLIFLPILHILLKLLTTLSKFFLNLHYAPVGKVHIQVVIFGFVFFFFLSNVCGFSAESMKKKILHLNLRSISLNWHNVCFSLSSYSIRLPKTTIVNHSPQQGTQSLLYALKMD